jgi:DNA-binding NarL/FixJ family response regulator
MRVLLADHHSRVRWALRTAISEEPSLNIVGEVVDGSSLLSQTEAVHPDLILLERELPGAENQDLLARLKVIEPQVCVIVLSRQAEFEASALAAGADAFVSKAGPPEELLAVLRRFAMEGKDVQAD